MSRIILDNGGGITVQLGAWAHFYDGSDYAKRCAGDLDEWIASGTTEDWEGHDPDALSVEPTAEEMRNGGYRVVELDRDIDTLSSLAAEVRETAIGWRNGEELAEAIANRVAV